MITEPFAPITPTASKRLREANPTTYKLWILLRQQHRPGITFRFSAQEVADELNRSENWVRKSLQALIDMGMVERLNQWFRGIYELRIIFQEGSSTDAQSTSHKSDRTAARTSVKSISNPDSFVPNNQRFKEKHEPVPTDQRNGYSIETDACTESQNAHCVQNREEVWREVMAIAPAFNRTSFIKLFDTYGAKRIQQAIEAVREQQAKGNLRQVERSLYTAIQKGFRRNQSVYREPLTEHASANACVNRQPQVFELTQASDHVCVNSLPQKLQLTQTSIPEPEPSFGSQQPAAATVDVSSQLAEISALIMLLNWDKTQVRTLLKQQYGTESPMDLTIPQINNWLEYLSHTVHDRSKG